MKIRLRTLLSGPAGTFQPGQVVDLPNGAELVARGYADAVDAPRVERAVVQAPEQAVAAPQRKARR